MSPGFPRRRRFLRRLAFETLEYRRLLSDVEVDLTADGDQAVLEDLGGGWSRVRSVNGTFDPIDFANPGLDGSLTINAGGGNDSLLVASLAADAADTLVLDGQGDTDTIEIAAALGLGSGGLTVAAEGIALAGGATIATAGGDVAWYGPVTLIAGSGATVPITTAGGSVTFAGAVDADVAEQRNLSADAGGGEVRFWQPVGAGAPLANLSISGAGAVTTGDVAWSGELFLEHSGAAAIDGVLSGVGGLTKAGVGTLTLAKGNSFTGSTHIAQGTVRLRNSLVAYYTFDDPQSLGQDSSGRNNHLVANGSPAFSSQGRFGGALSLTGTPDYLKQDATFPAGVPTGAAGYTISAWINPHANPSLEGIVGWGNYGATGQANALRVNSDTQVLNFWKNSFLQGNTTDSLSAGDAPEGWHHVAATYDPATYGHYLYVDGMQVASRMSGGLNAQPLNFTVGVTQTTQYFSGLLDDIAIFDRPLSVEEIVALSQQNVDAAHTYPGSYLPDAGSVTVADGAVLDLSEVDETIGPLAGAAGSRVMLGGGNLTVNAAFGSVFAGEISGSGGLRKEGPGTLTLSGDNSYTGTTTVREGVLVAASDTALGSASGETVVAPRGPVNLRHRYSFSETGGAGTPLVDSIGGADATIVDLGVNDAAAGGGRVTLVGGTKDSSDYVTLPAGLVSPLKDATLELWATQHRVQSWSRIFDFGRDAGDYLVMCWTRGTDPHTDRVAWADEGLSDTTVDDSNAPYELDREYHLVLTVEEDAGSNGGTLVTWYQDATLRGSFETTFRLSQLTDTNLWLGRSLWNNYTASASYNEFRIYEGAMSPLQVAASRAAGPDASEPGYSGDAALALDGSLAGPVTLAAEPLALASGGDLRNLAGENTVSGPIHAAYEIGGGVTIGSDAGSLTLTGDVDLALSSLAVTGAGETRILASIHSSYSSAQAWTPGLLAGHLPGSMSTEANPGNAWDLLSPHTGLTNRSGPWASNLTWVYTGQFYDADGFFSFAENIADQVWVSLDGSVILNDAAASAPSTTGNPGFGMGPQGDGWHDIEIRFGNATGAAGAVTGNGWTATFGFGYNPAGSTSTNGADYLAPVDPGDGTLFRHNPQPRPANDVTKMGSGTLILAGDNRYSGETFAVQGRLQVDGQIGAGGVAGTVSVADGATLAGGGTVNAPVSGVGGSIVIATGNLTLGAGSDPDGIAILGFLDVGAHTVQLRDQNAAVVNHADLDGGVLRSATPLRIGGWLTGFGAVETAVQIGTHDLAPGPYFGGDPGAAHTTGQLAVAGIEFGAAGQSGRYRVDVNGATPGAEYDQLVVHGPVVLSDADGAAELIVTVGVAPPAGAQLLIVANDDADPVIGEFTGLPEGSRVWLGGVAATITYRGGDGNDVAILVPSPLRIIATDPPLDQELIAPTATIDVTFGGPIDPLTFDLSDVGLLDLDAPQLSLVSQFGGIFLDSQVVGSLLYAATGAGLQILDISDPANVTWVGGYDTSDTAVGLQVVGDFVYLAAGEAGLEILNVSNPTNVIRLGGYDIGAMAYDVQVTDSRAYVAFDDAGLRILDISNPASPTWLGGYDTPSFARGVQVVGNRAYVADLFSGLQILDVANPANVLWLGGYDTPDVAQHAQVVGNLAYVADGASGLQILDVSNPANVTRVGGYDTNEARDVRVLGNVAFVADWRTGVGILNVSDPAHVTVLGAFDTPGYAGAVDVGGSSAYVADGWAGLQILNVSNPASVTRRGGYGTSDYVSDLEIVGHLAYVADRAMGLQILDVSDPAGMIRVGGYDTSDQAWDVDVVGSVAYVADDATGLQILDVSNPASVFPLGQFDTPGSARRVQVVDRVAYVVDEHSGLLILDVSKPTAVTQWGGYANSADYAYDVDVAGPLAYFANGYDGIHILDVSEPADVIRLGGFDTPGRAVGVQVVGHLAYVADIDAGLQILDVSDPTSVTWLGAYDTPDMACEVNVVGSLAYVGDGRSGVQILDVSDPSRVAWVGRYDTSGLAEHVGLVGHLAYVDDSTGGLDAIQVGLPAASISHVSGNTYRIAFGQIIQSGSYALQVGPEINDLGGTAMDQDRDGTPGEDGPDVYAVRFRVDAPPTDISLAPSAVGESEPIGMLVGTFTASDVDLPGDWHTYSLLDTANYPDNAAFTVAGNELRTNSVFDYETKDRYTIRVRTTDAAGLWYEDDLTIHVTDVDEIPPTVTGTTPSWTVSGTLGAGTSSIQVMFSEPVIGGGAAGKYRLQSLGPDALLGTADDTIITLSASYAGTTATLGFSALPASVYRLTVHDAIIDAAGNPLDGDANGTAGGDWVSDFVVLRSGDLFYSTPTYNSGGRHPWSLAIGDLNGDGRADLAVANRDTPNVGNVGVLLGLADGTFAAAATYSSGGETPASVAIGDLNGDGLADLAVTNFDSDTVAVLLGQAGGTFAPATTYGSGGRYPWSVAIGDLNGDGRADLAVANYGGNVGVLVGQASGGLAPATTYSSGGGSPRSVAIGDLNGDGRADLAVANYHSGDVGVLLGQPGGTLATAMTYSSGGSNPESLAIGDLNGDGRPDLAVANSGSENVGVLLGEPGGTFLVVATYSSGGNHPSCVAIGDLNGDGRADLAVANRDSGDVGVLPGQPDGTLAAAATYNVSGNNPDSTAIGDLNGDGRADLAVTTWDSGYVAVLLGQANGTFTAAARTYGSGGSLWSGPISMAVGGLNTDGFADLAVANSGSSGNVGVLLGQQGGTFASAMTYSSGDRYPESVAIGDLNGDPWADLAVANSGSVGNVGVLLGEPSGTFWGLATYSTGGNGPRSVAIGDLNGDGRADLAVANSEGGNRGNVGVLLGQAGGAFAAATTSDSGGNGPRSVAIGDLNGDGRADLAVANSWNNIGVLLGQGDGSFAAATTYESGGNYPESVAIGDLNGDGRADLAVANSSGTVGVLLGQADGTLAAAATYGTGGDGPRSVAIGDLNGDGRADLAVANYWSGNLGVLLGQADGTLAAAAAYSSSGAPVSVVIGDLNGDGRADLAAANEYGGNVGVLPNSLAFAVFSPHGFLFDIQPGGPMAGQLVDGSQNAFDGLNRLHVGAIDYGPAPKQLSFQDGMRTLLISPQTIAGLTVHREITVPAMGNEDFARTVDVFSNPTDAPITTTVRIVGNLGSDAATTVWMTSDGDTLVEPTDQWIGTDDADGSGAPAIIHYIHGPAGLVPMTVSRSGDFGDNVEWTYNLTVPAGETVRLAHFTILAESRTAAEAAADALVTLAGFGGQAAAFLTAQELDSVANFVYDRTPPTVTGLSPPDNAVGVPLDTSLAITFGEPIRKGSGTIVLRKASDDSVVETIGVAGAGLSIMGATATIVPSVTLDVLTEYYVEVTSGTFEDQAGNAFAGIAGATAWNFTTQTFQVTGLIPNASGFTATFNGPLETSVLNLYDGAAGELDAADAVVLDGAGQRLAGSLIVDQTRRVMTWVATGDVLTPGAYVLTLRSGTAAFRDVVGHTLDGDVDGASGGDFLCAFTVAATSRRVVSVADIARGAGQPVNVPAAAAGWPLRISDAQGVTSLAVDILYDPALLQITAATLAAGLPGDWSVVNPPDTSTPGVAKIRAAGTAPLSGTDLDVVRLTAAVPSNAPYGASQAIRLENVVLNGGAIAAIGDVAVHKAAYLGDADSSGIHSSADAFLTVQAALGLASGFAAHRWTDPRIVGDADGSSVLSAADAFLIVQEGLGLVEPFVPDNPHIGITPVGGGVDPQFRIGESIPAEAGGVVTVPVQLGIEPAATNVGGFDFDLFFDPAQLTIQLPGGVSAGADTAGWAVSAILVAPGQLRVGMMSSDGQPLAVGLREIARLRFLVEAGKSSRTGWQPVLPCCHRSPTTDHRLPVTDYRSPVTGLSDGLDGSETHPTWLDIEPVDARAGGYTWTDADGSLLIRPAEGAPAGATRERVWRDLDAKADLLESVLADLVHDVASAWR